MEPKWDIVENVATPNTAQSSGRTVRRNAKRAMLRAVATTIFAGTLALPAFAISKPVMLLPDDFVVSTGQETGFIQVKSGFVRPRGDRKAQASLETDTNIGMSTRRLGEAYTKLFRPVEDEDTELTGEYSFL
jgi:hypothetical protein